ncbi:MULTISPECIES: cytochrome c oxidase subunit 3 [unclassified Leeuwenhoekiella]|uniref:cytochrome c oxidase subunit 3 n=1 Tax=unclassified Leeuwenhoekiella TaxID=2615029 RepID=UPI000C68C5A8|nr:MULTISPECIES: cytochrome c oxidase subunit 3 [unclassified Leeuwenhoekiella]MAW96372.1 cytochrome oxidase subunit III [Leeuwenhoekiella sp.]MBA81259.1 cytochrome oxidase subunit III [Leeuwenhoekiella sp.]|tara:strand:+ start:34539 stop:35132 length:594 start_codon:yes stop_codon:yes gene_type:complete
MDYTSQSQQVKIARSKKMMLWFGIVSLSMMFGGLTSAYIVSSERKDWLHDFQLPQAFYISTAIIILSSLSMLVAKRAISKENNTLGTLALVVTAILGIGFVIFQFKGFGEIVQEGYFFTGSQSNVTTSFIYAFVISHVIHVAAGILVLLVILVQQLRGKYASGQTLGLELGATFWHFVDILWIYLFLFFMFAEDIIH